MGVEDSPFIQSFILHINVAFIVCLRNEIPLCIRPIVTVSRKTMKGTLFKFMHMSQFRLFVRCGLGVLFSSVLTGQNCRYAAIAIAEVKSANSLRSETERL